MASVQHVGMHSQVGSHFVQYSDTFHPISASTLRTLQLSTFSYILMICMSHILSNEHVLDHWIWLDVTFIFNASGHNFVPSIAGHSVVNRCLEYIIFRVDFINKYKIILQYILCLYLGYMNDFSIISQRHQIFIWCHHAFLCSSLYQDCHTKPHADRWLCLVICNIMLLWLVCLYMVCIASKGRTKD